MPRLRLTNKSPSASLPLKEGKPPGSSETRSDHPLRGIFAESTTKLSENPALADTVHDIVLMMSTLVGAADQYLRPEHYRSGPDHYARNLVYDGEETGMSFHRLVWEQGQWIPVHDHGTCGGSESSGTSWKNKVTWSSVLTRVSISMTASSLSAGASCCCRRGRGLGLCTKPGPYPQNRRHRGSAALCESPPLWLGDEFVHFYDPQAGTRELTAVAQRETRLGQCD